MTGAPNLVFLGPPGAGKGTQANRLAEAWEVPHVSTGDLLRQHLKDETPVGLMARGFMQRGLLVPDDVVCQMVRERLEEEDAAAGFILDGFPRTIAQAETLDGDLSRMGRHLQAVVSFEIEDGRILERLTGRRTCRSCGAVHHVMFHPPEKDGVCDACGGELYTREDDREDAVRARLEEYRDKTAPLLDYYQRRDLLVAVDAGRPVDEVCSALESVLEGR